LLSYFIFFYLVSTNAARFNTVTLFDLNEIPKYEKIAILVKTVITINIIKGTCVVMNFGKSITIKLYIYYFIWNYFIWN